MHRSEGGCSNQTVAGLKPRMDAVEEQITPGSNQTVAGLKQSGLLTKRNEVKFKSDRCGIETVVERWSKKAECVQIRPLRD